MTYTLVVIRPLSNNLLFVIQWSVLIHNQKLSYSIPSSYYCEKLFKSLKKSTLFPRLRNAQQKLQMPRLWPAETSFGGVAKNQNRQALARGERGTKETRPPCRKICMGQRAVASDSIIAGQRHTDYVGAAKNKEHFETKEDHRLQSGLPRGSWAPEFLLSVTNVPGHRAYGSGVFQAHDEMRLVPTVYARAAHRNSLPPAR